MNIELPLYRQEKPNTCALACLRMVLAAFGRERREKIVLAAEVIFEIDFISVLWLLGLAFIIGCLILGVCWIIASRRRPRQ